MDLTADAIEQYLRDRLEQCVRVRMNNGHREKGLLIFNSPPGVSCSQAYVEHSGPQEALKGLFRPHYVTWSEQQNIESHLSNIVRIITETGSRVYKELAPMKKDQVDLANAAVWIPDSKTPNGTTQVPLTPSALEGFRSQMTISPNSPFLFPSDRNPSGHQATFKTVWTKTLRHAKIPYFRIYDLRSTYSTRLSARGVADEWVTQMLRQGDAQFFKKYSQMKLQMKREALEKLNRRAGEMSPMSVERMCTVAVQ